MTADLGARVTFNIIYIPGTVRYLSFFVLSLLKWSDCSYRLVSNGCLQEEVDQLKKLCSKSPRLEFLMLSPEKTLWHFEALAVLQKMERSDLFCFMDSDILATGNFLSELLPLVGKDRFAVCSGSAISYPRKDRIARRSSNILRGSHSYLGDLCLGSTFFAIYNNAKLSHFIRSNGLAFERYRRWEDVPERFKASLRQAGIGQNVYDTGKLLNILAQMQGESVIYKDSTALVHIGRLSGHVKNRPKKKRAISHGTFPGIVGVVQRWQDRRVVRKNRKVSAYFFALFDALFEGRPFERKIPVFHPEVRKNIRRATDQITDFYKAVQREHSERLRCQA